MEFKKEKLVRYFVLFSFSSFNSFETWVIDFHFSFFFVICRFYNDGKGETQHIEKSLPVYKSSAPLLKTEGKIVERNRIASKIPKFGEPWRKRILDPGSEVILQWNRVFLFWCLVALFVDPLFFYLPSIEKNGNGSCMTTDLNLGIIVTCFRTFADVFYLLHVVIKFRTAYVSPSSRVFGRGELVLDPKEISWRYLKSDFFIDLLAALPLPQVLSVKCIQLFVYWVESWMFDIIRP